jgi:MFS family permease
MQRVNMGRFLSANMFIWGIIVLCIAFSQNFAGLMVLRSLQGIAECTISPTFLMLTGAWVWIIGGWKLAYFLIPLFHLQHITLLSR